MGTTQVESSYREWSEDSESGTKGNGRIASHNLGSRRIRSVLKRLRPSSTILKLIDQYPHVTEQVMIPSHLVVTLPDSSNGGIRFSLTHPRN